MAKLTRLRRKAAEAVQLRLLSRTPAAGPPVLERTATAAQEIYHSLSTFAVTLFSITPVSTKGFWEAP